MVRRALDVPAMPLGHRRRDDARRPASSSLGALDFGFRHSRRAWYCVTRELVGAL
jgi:hypothetical protein